jgi:hypothetical protein
MDLRSLGPGEYHGELSIEQFAHEWDLDIGGSSGQIEESSLRLKELILWCCYLHNGFSEDGNIWAVDLDLLLLVLQRVVGVEAITQLNLVAINVVILLVYHIRENKVEWLGQSLSGVPVENMGAQVDKLRSAIEIGEILNGQFKEDGRVVFVSGLHFNLVVCAIAHLWEEAGLVLGPSGQSLSCNIAILEAAAWMTCEG